ncbi:MAG TPA: thioredoxin family protein [Casimicrobiaceae bacterium]|nr:thioredoxin family protein [Casimicrobiaceae bacterium]
MTQQADATNIATGAAAGEVVELDSDAFASTIPNHPFAIIDFWAPWCAPCRAFAPVFAQAAKKHPEILFAKVNTDAEQGLSAHFNIRSIPMLMVFRDNVIVFSQAGALSAGALEQVIKGASDLDMDEVRRELEKQSESSDS